MKILNIALIVIVVVIILLPLAIITVLIVAVAIVRTCRLSGAATCLFCNVDSTALHLPIEVGHRLNRSLRLAGIDRGWPINLDAGRRQRIEVVGILRACIGQGHISGISGLRWRQDSKPILREVEISRCEPCCVGGVEIRHRDTKARRSITPGRSIAQILSNGGEHGCCRSLVGRIFDDLETGGDEPLQGKYAYCRDTECDDDLHEGEGL